MAQGGDLHTRQGSLPYLVSEEEKFMFLPKFVLKGNLQACRRGPPSPRREGETWATQLPCPGSPRRAHECSSTEHARVVGTRGFGQVCEVNSSAEGTKEPQSTGDHLRSPTWITKCRLREKSAPCFTANGSLPCSPSPPPGLHQFPHADGAQNGQDLPPQLQPSLGHEAYELHGWMGFIS